MSLNDISMKKSPAHRTRSSTEFGSSKSPPYSSEQHLSRRSRRMSLVSALWYTVIICFHLYSLSFNPLSPSIHIQILQTDLHTFPLRISWENLIKHQGVFSFVIIFYILTTLSLDNVWRLLGENCCWSLLGLKGLRKVKVGIF